MMTRWMRGAMAAFAIMGCMAMQPAKADSSTHAVAAANAGTVGLISGGVDGTYVRIAADLGTVLDDGDRLRVLTIIGKGSLQNIADILYRRGVDVGIVQSDVMAYARLHHLFPGLPQSIQYISKLYDEEVHILAAKNITSIADLAGKTVNTDVLGSGTAMTASVVFDSLGIPVTFTHFDQNTALNKLEHGELSAMIYVTGEPARLFTDADRDKGLHFVGVPLTPALAATYVPAKITNTAYPSLVPADAPVATIAVPSVMAVYAWPAGTERYTKVARFVDAFFNHFPALLRPPHHPKWHQVDRTAEVPGWTRFAPARQWLAQWKLSEPRDTRSAMMN